MKILDKILVPSNRIVINCKSKKDAENLMKIAHENELTWFDGDSYIKNDLYDYYGAHTCYELAKNDYGYKEEFIEKNYKILVYPDDSSLIFEDEVIIINKAEDFNGMTNGLGLSLSVAIISKEIVIRMFDFGNKLINGFLYKNQIELEKLKQYGFKFKLKEKLSLEQVLRKYKQKTFEIDEENCYITYKKNTGKYDFIISTINEIVESKCYSITDIRNILKELNE